MRRLRSFAAAVPLLAFSTLPARAQGANHVVDEGTFLITRTGAPPTTENFKIVRLDDGVILATGQASSGTRRISSALRTDSVGTPVEFILSVNEGKASILKLSSMARAGRLSTRATDQHGDESMREYPVTAGHSVILEDELVHQTYFVALGKRAGQVHVIDPRTSHGTSFTLTARGLEPIEVAGRSVTATHYSMVNGTAPRDFWIDDAGRLLRVEIPSLGLKAVREELPR